MSCVKGGNEGESALLREWEDVMGVCEWGNSE